MARNAMRVASVLLLVAALYWPDAVALGRYWLDQDVNAQAGVLIAVLSVFLLFRLRGRFAQISMGPVLWACLPLIACGAASLIGWRAGILTLQLFFLPLILWFAVLAVLGWQAARLTAFALGFLYFAVPGWGLLGPALQHLTAWAVGVFGPVFGLPVAMSGTSASLPGGLRFVVEPACSGVDFLTVGLAIATLQGELEPARLSRRARLIGGMTLLAIVSNWIRVILIIEIGYRSHMRSALATRDHLAFGWVIFACALAVFVWLAGRSVAAPSDARGERPHGEDAAPPTAYPTHPWRYGLVAAGLLAAPALAYARLPATEARAGGAVFELPPGRTPWQGSAAAADSSWQPEFVGAHVERRARYQSADGHAVEVVAIGYPRQAQGAQILSAGNSILGNHGWAMEAVVLVQGAGVPHGEVIAVDPQGRRSVIWSIIDIGGRLFGEPLSSQLWYGARALTGTPYSALFALRVECDGSCDAARATLVDFLRVNGAALFASLPDRDVAG
jgi:EpsI family protein